MLHYGSNFVAPVILLSVNIVLFNSILLVRPASAAAQLAQEATPSQSTSFASYAIQQQQPFLVDYNGRRCIVRIRRRSDGPPPNTQQQLQNLVVGPASKSGGGELVSSDSNVVPQFVKQPDNAAQQRQVNINIISNLATPPPPAQATTPYHYSYRTRPPQYATTPAAAAAVPRNEQQTSSTPAYPTTSPTARRPNPNIMSGKFRNWWSQFQDAHNVAKLVDRDVNSLQYQQQQQTSEEPAVVRQDTTSPLPRQQRPPQRQVEVNISLNQNDVPPQRPTSSSAAPSTTTTTARRTTTTPTTEQQSSAATSAAASPPARLLFTEATTAPEQQTPPASTSSTTTQFPRSQRERERDSTRHSFSWWLTKIPMESSTTTQRPTTPRAVQYGFFSQKRGTVSDASSTSSSSSVKLNSDASQQIANTQQIVQSNSVENAPQKRRPTADRNSEPEFEAQDSLIFYSVAKPSAAATNNDNKNNQQQPQELPHFPLPPTEAPPQRQLFTTKTLLPPATPLASPQQQQQTEQQQPPAAVSSTAATTTQETSPPTTTAAAAEQIQQQPAQAIQAQPPSDTNQQTPPPVEQQQSVQMAAAATRQDDINREQYQAQLYKQKMYKLQPFRDFFRTSTTTTTTTTTTQTPTTWAPPAISELVRKTWQQVLQVEAPGTLTPDEVKRVVATGGNLTSDGNGNALQLPEGYFASDPFLCRSQKRYIRGPVVWRSCNESESWLEISDLVVYKEAGIPIDECVTDPSPNGDRCTTLQNGVARCVQKYAHYGLIGKDKSGKKQHFCFEFPSGCECQIVKYETVTAGASANASTEQPVTSTTVSPVLA